MLLFFLKWYFSTYRFVPLYRMCEIWFSRNHLIFIFIEKKKSIHFVSLFNSHRLRLNHLYHHHVNWFNSVTRPSQRLETILKALPIQVMTTTATAIMRRRSLHSSKYLINRTKFVDVIDFCMYLRRTFNSTAYSRYKLIENIFLLKNRDKNYCAIAKLWSLN